MEYDLSLASSMIETLDIDAGTKSSMLDSFSRRLELFGKEINFFREPFTPVSLTGNECSLQCKHCNKYYLDHMLDGRNDKLYPEARYLANRGDKGILLSGGTIIDGSVPSYRFAGNIEKIREDTGLKISAHTGLVDASQSLVLSRFLDMALVDVIGDNDTIKEILGLEACVEDYEKTVGYLYRAGIALAPHIIVGLHYGELKGEFRALDIVKKFDPEIVVIVVFIPTKGTPLEGLPPPSLESVVKVITKARSMFDVPVSLSCVRPGGRYRSMLDTFAILSGVDRIAVPSRKAYTTCKELGLNINEIKKMCCSYRI